MIDKGFIKPKPSAQFIIQHAEYGYTSNLPLEIVLQETFLLATHYDGQPLTPDHGYPLRGIVGHIPDRDDLKKMKTYVTYFNERFMSARADIDHVNTLTDAIGILHYIVKSTDGVYEVAHSGSLVLIDPEARFSGVFSSPHEFNKIAHDLSALINS